MSKHSSKPLPKRLFTLAEAASYLGRPVYGVRELVWRHELPVVRDNPKGKIYVAVEDLDSYVTRKRAAA